MKTTLPLPDELYREIKASAALSGRSITSIVEESLRRFLADAATVEDLPPLPVSPSRGGFTDHFMATGIDVNDTSGVLAWLDQVEGRRP